MTIIIRRPPDGDCRDIGFGASPTGDFSRMFDRLMQW